MHALTTHARDWEDLAALDPMWAILSADEAREGKWSPDRFYETGEREVGRLLDRADELCLPRQRVRALDVGCGLGRHAQPLARCFEAYLGLDVSSTMISQAREVHRDLSAAAFQVANAIELTGLPANWFDFVECWFVLFHLPSQDAILRALRRLVQVLRPTGLLIFQVALPLPTRHRVQVRRRAYELLRWAGVSPGTLYRRLRLSPIRMTAVPVDRVVEQLRALGARVVATESGQLGPEIASLTFFVTK